MEVLLPTSPTEAAEAFGDGASVTVVAGGTIVMPEIAYGRFKPPGRTLVLSRAGLDRIDRANGTVTIGAACPVASLIGGDEPLAAAAAHVADPEIRAQATVGGNVCATGADAPRGDLQAPLIALGAQVRSTGAGGERTEPLEQFLGSPARLVLDVSYPDVPRTAAYAATFRPHSHHYTILAAAAVKEGDAIRVALTGAGPTGRRCPSVEAALASGASASEAAGKALDDVADSLGDDALASAWYRRRVLPSLVARVLQEVS